MSELDNTAKRELDMSAKRERDNIVQATDILDENSAVLCFERF
jgi:hypothetical protein